MLNPNYDMKSRILCFKEDTVKQILSAVPRLASSQALQLLQRGDLAPNPLQVTLLCNSGWFSHVFTPYFCSGEDFLRPRLPDASARKQLAALLLLRLKLPGEHGNVGKEVVSLVAETQDSQQLQEAFRTMEESEKVTLLSSLDETAVNQLSVAMQPCDNECKGLVDKELARRLASRLNEERVKMLWQLVQAHQDAKEDSWARAAACLLSAQMGRIEVHFGTLSLEVLVEARNFLHDPSSAISFAQDFFTYDLGISTAEQWPLKSSAPILHELANRLSEDESEEKLDLLLTAHSIDESDLLIRTSLHKLLHAHLLSQEAGKGSSREGLFLKLALEEGSVPQEVLPKLTLSECHLRQASPEQLMNLCQQLVESDRPADGARVAVFAAKAFTLKGQVRQSEEAFVKAFALDRSNQEVAEGLANAVTSAHKRCEEVEYRCAELEKTGRASDERFEAQCKELRMKTQELEAQCQTLQRPCALSSIVWDLSSYDFTGFCQNQYEWSEGFQLLSSGVTAWLKIYPKGHSKSYEGQAALFLRVDKPAIVKWSWQSGSGEVETCERDFSEKWNNSWGRSNFMPSSEANCSVTLRILSVQLPRSQLRFC